MIWITNYDGTGIENLMLRLLAVAIHDNILCWRRPSALAALMASVNFVRNLLIYTQKQLHKSTAS